MRSDVIKRGIDRAPHRSLLRAVGCSSTDWDKPFIGVINSYSEIVPGHIHLSTISRAVKEGVRSRGGVPFEVNVPIICDGIAMNHLGMKYSLPSRELIADTVESLVEAHAFDALADGRGTSYTRQAPDDNRQPRILSEGNRQSRYHGDWHMEKIQRRR